MTLSARANSIYKDKTCEGTLPCDLKNADLGTSQPCSSRPLNTRAFNFKMMRLALPLLGNQLIL